MSTGLGRFNARRTKLKYLSKKAAEKNQEQGFDETYFDRFEKQLENDPYFPQEPKKQPEPLFKAEDRVESLPIEREGNVSTPYPLPLFHSNSQLEPQFGILNVGLKTTHMEPSITKHRFNQMRNYYNNIQSDDPRCKPSTSITLFTPKNYGLTLQVVHQRKVLEEGKEHDQRMKKEIYKDHISEMMGGDTFKKTPEVSEFSQHFGKSSHLSPSPTIVEENGEFLLTLLVYDKDMKNELAGHEWENHFTKNDLNQYNEAYLKYKDTMRKFVAPDKR